LVRGSPIVVPDGDGPLAPLAAAEAARATVWPSAPAYLQALLRLSQPPPWPSSLRLVVSASAPLPGETAAQFRARFGLPVHVFYGASECGGICYDRDGTAAERGTVGEPVEGVGVTVERVGEDGAEGAVQVGSPSGGIVEVESPAVALGYLPSPDPRLSDGRFAT